MKFYTLTLLLLLSGCRMAYATVITDSKGWIPQDIIFNPKPPDPFGYETTTGTWKIKWCRQKFYINDDTVPVYFGMRDDGIVIWRKKP